MMYEANKCDNFRAHAFKMRQSMSVSFEANICMQITLVKIKFLQSSYKFAS